MPDGGRPFSVALTAGHQTASGAFPVHARNHLDGLLLKDRCSMPGSLLRHRTKLPLHVPKAAEGVNQPGCTLQPRDHEPYALATVSSGTERTKRRFKAPPAESGARRNTASRHNQSPCLGRGEAPVGQPSAAQRKPRRSGAKDLCLKPQGGNVGGETQRQHFTRFSARCDPPNRGQKPQQAAASQGAQFRWCMSDRFEAARLAKVQRRETA